jgi:triosephosphate isomerase
MAGNWKMNLNHLEAIAHVQKLAFALADKDYEAVEVAVLPPFTDLRSVQTLVDGDKLKIKYGAQDLSAHDSGAYTGEISGSMLAKLKCTYVAIGHSERRQYHAETVVIAYEPVWAIGTGKVCGAEDAQEVCAAIRGKIAELYSQDLAAKVRIQYGGSVKSGNVAEIMAQADIDGALVGGASLDADEFVKIVRFRDQ